MLIDTHAHVNFNAFKDDSGEVIKRSLASSVWMINVGSQFSTSQRAAKMAARYPEGVYAAVGLHPIHLSASEFHDTFESEEIKFRASGEKFDADIYKKLAQNPKVVAIGETGLDYFHNPENKVEQAEVFREHIKLACELNLPLMVHCRDAHTDLISVLSEEKKKYGDKLLGVIHGFASGFSVGISEAKAYIDMGFLLGVNGIITFSNQYDSLLREIDLKHFLLETDCPYLTPKPHRGKRNEPLYVKYVAQKIAEVRGVDISEVKKKTTENARRVFAI